MLIIQGTTLQHHELDEDAIRYQKRQENQNKKKYQSTAQFKQAPNKGNRIEQVKKKQKSDFTLTFVDTSQQVEKLAIKSEAAEKIEKMRNIAQRRSNQGTTSQVESTNAMQRRGSGSYSPKVGERRTSQEVKKGAMSPDAFKRR